MHRAAQQQSPLPSREEPAPDLIRGLGGGGAAPPMLEVRNLSVAYGGLRALTDVSLAVAEGQFVTVLGPNGAGKSTLFKTICGIVAPVQGSVSFLGQDLFATSASA